MFCKEGKFDVVELSVNDQFKTFNINLNAQHVNGMTPFDLALSTVIRYSKAQQYVAHWLLLLLLHKKLVKVWPTLRSNME